MKAPALRKGDRIGIFSPSSPITATVPSRYQRGKAFLESKGFEIVEGSLTGKKDHYRSGSIKERADELNALIRDESVRCIMSTIGGNNSNSILPYIDYDALMRDPKIIVGYSDVTALILGIYAKTGLVTLYGPAAAASFGELPPFVDETFSGFERVAMKKEKAPFTFPTPKEWTDERLDWAHQDRSKTGRKNELVTVNGGKATGRLIGGNLNTMEGFFGTAYMPEIREGDILMIEDTMKNPSIIERSFSMLKLGGVFDRIGGLVLGKHELFDDGGTGRKPYEIMMEVVGNVDYPILAEYDSCHTHPMTTLPIGCTVTLDSEKKEMTLLEDAVL